MNSEALCLTWCVIVADGKIKEILADAKLLEAHGLEKP
jgi:hypothetical protein